MSKKRICGRPGKIIGFILISKYMIKKYGLEDAIIRTAKGKGKTVRHHVSAN